ncbi:fimbrial protein [Paraburkholderia caballeronis]|uniref:fimbrial protein n=1 Tax=Paraburkholderia caballeronis TaxID=416943 RepID=UPI0014170ED9|nr:fimbrial protein [Paraburkholderia caballeronis]
MNQFVLHKSGPTSRREKLVTLQITGLSPEQIKNLFSKRRYAKLDFLAVFFNQLPTGSDMNRKIITSTLALAAIGLSTSAFATGPQTGQIQITGKVVDTTCSVDAASQNVTVTLPTVDKSSLSSAASSAALTPFAITVDGCAQTDGADTVSVAFVPDSNVDANGNLLNQAAGGAQNVAVQILDNSRNVVNVNTDTVTAQQARGSSTDVAGAPVTLQYYAQYYSALGGTTAGAVSALANFQLVYE